MPEMSFGILGAEFARPVVRILDLQDDLGAGRLGAGESRIDVGDIQIDCP
jgi:hypothetical protein